MTTWTVVSVTGGHIHCVAEATVGSRNLLLILLLLATLISALQLEARILLLLTARILTLLAAAFMFLLLLAARVGFFKHLMLPFWSLLTRYLVTFRQN